MRRYLLLVIVAGVLLAPAIASAVDWFPIVPCGSSGQALCTTCDIFKTFKNVIDLVLFGITGPIAAFMIVWAGGLMLLGGANAGLYSQGTKMLRNTLYGVAIILLSWLATNTLIKSLATGSTTDSWNEFSCPVYLQQADAAEPPPLSPPQGTAENPRTELLVAAAATCSNANLAAAYGVPNNPQLNSPSLNAMISCLNSDPIVSALYNPNLFFSWEHSNPKCNLTHGQELCGNCAHSVGSCHYGGKRGTQGSMAIDYNWNGKRITYLIASRTIVPSNSEACKAKPSDCRTVTSGEGLYEELYRAATLNRCDYKMLNFEPSRGAHTHISTKDCDSDGLGTTENGKYRAPPILP